MVEGAKNSQLCIYSTCLQSNLLLDETCQMLNWRHLLHTEQDSCERY